MLMRITFFAVTTVSLAAYVPAYNCSKPGQECSFPSDCCNHDAKVDPVYCEYEGTGPDRSVCVTQPKCAKDRMQCKGKGQSVMQETPCCTKGFTCVDVDQYYSHCINASAPEPPPPPPGLPPPSCALVGDQCDGSGFKTVGCCNKESKCEAVNPYFYKCVDQPKCVGENVMCSGSGQHPMEPTPCCDSDHSCVTWGTDFSTCRAKGRETCAASGEQCLGDIIPKKDCCDTDYYCRSVNQYYGVCARKTDA